MSVGQPTRHRTSSFSASRSINRSMTPVSIQSTSFDVEPDQPCAATASLFLFAQGRSILCLHHDTLAVERRFEKHKQAVVLISVDNVSERGAGRLVVSYDGERTAIVWDLFTGDEIARFASYEQIKVAAWMKNGNVAFGNSQGNVILFEPSTSDHRSARTIFDPITALAPAADCQTYAIGYQNGSILLVALQPNFTILHTLSTSRAPSPIVGLAWHASSSKQKSDMLATQSADGDLRVWSIGKPPTAETPKVIRMLKRGDNVESGLNWIAWSKNGRILQFSQGETWSWDVRTKHVAYEPIPTIEGVTALANYGSTATLFTLGPDNSVQQYDLNPPALVKSVQHHPMSPPFQQHVSSQSTPKMAHHFIPGAAPPVPVFRTQEASRGPASLSTIQRASDEMSAIEHARQLRSEIGSPLSTTSRTESINSRSSAGQYQNRAPSVSSRAASGTTFSTFAPSLIGRDSVSGAASPFFPRTASVASSGRRSRGGSRLRQEILHSPEEQQLVDLFPHARARLSSLPYTAQPPTLDPTKLSASELRKQMLEVVFGWDGDIEDMIRDELGHHAPGSMNATLLSKWLGEVNVDTMAAAIGSESISTTDWMLLALSQMNGQGAASKQLGQSFVQRLLQQGDIHTAATILLGMGDREDAVEIYVSRCFYMEGILLTCLLFPDEWERQAHLVRRWGEFVVENSQQHLAIRCFSCTGVDTSLPWASPTQSPFTGSQPPPSMPQVISPPTSPPPNQQSSQSRMTAKNASLKLITSFGKSDAKFKFPGLLSEDRTPTNAPGITPIAESALSPGGTPSTYLRPQVRSRNNLNVKTPGGYSRNRLPSIGETPIDSVPPPFPLTRPGALPTPNDSGSDREREKQPETKTQEASTPSIIEDAPLTLSSARYEPEADATPHATPQTALPNTAIKNILPFSLNEDRFAALSNGSRIRNGSRDRKPDGLHIQMPSLSQVNLNAYVTSATSESPRSRHRRSNTASIHSGSSASGRFDFRNDAKSPPLTGQSFSSSAKSPSVSGRSIDQYISSLEEAQYYAQNQQRDARRTQRSKEGRSRTAKEAENSSRHKTRHREQSEDRGRGGQRYIRPAKRSPSSPVPMSPEDLQKYRDANSQSIGSTLSLNHDSSDDAAPLHSRGHSTQRKSASKNRSQSKTSDWSHRTVRRRSPSVSMDHLLVNETSRESLASGRDRSPDILLSPMSYRGRSKSKHAGSTSRSPSSPLPMALPPKSAQVSGDDEDPMRLVEKNRQRLRSAHRSTSRRPRERGTSSRREISPDRRLVAEERQPYTSQAREASQRNDSSTDQKTSDGERVPSDGNERSLNRTKSHRTLKKEMAARELEARRESLSQRILTPMIPSPSTLPNATRPNTLVRSQTDLSNSPTTTSWSRVGSPQQYVSDHSGSSEFSPIDRASSTGPYGLPATPRAMRHPKYSSSHAIEEIPAVPELPDAFYQPSRMELPRSMSAPIPEPEISPPSDMPTHPAFHRGLRPSTNKRPNFSPLGDIGRQRRTPSIDSPPLATLGSQGIASIDETLHSTKGVDIVVVPEQPTQPPILPELQHLAAQHPLPPPPPPPPPPPHPAFRADDAPAHHSLSSGSGVGTINIVMDDLSRSTTPVIDVPANPTSSSSSSNNNNSGHHGVPPPPPPPTMMMMTMNPTTSPPPPPINGHSRGRSIDGFGGKIKGMADRMRSSSRGRHTRSPRLGVDAPVQMVPSPYESLPQYF